MYASTATKYAVGALTPQPLLSTGNTFPDFKLKDKLLLITCPKVDRVIKLVTNNRTMPNFFVLLSTIGLYFKFSIYYCTKVM